MSRRNVRTLVKEDRLSSLPDEVLHHILSFNDASMAVQTSVLSKRWRNVWKAIPVLNFQDQYFDDPFLFHDFVDHFLQRRDESTILTTLKLICRDELDDGDIVDSTIDYVSQTNASASIQNLHILAECPVSNLPQLSLCESLTTLRLANIFTETTEFSFPTLRNFHLQDCRFECMDEPVMDPFRGCVNLEHLSVHASQYYGSFDTFEVCAPLLTEFSISYLRVNERVYPHCAIKLSTPRLRSFSYSDSELYKFQIDETLPSLNQVHIDLECLDKNTDLAQGLIDLFEAMGSAKSVSFSPGILQVLARFPALLEGRAPPFSRMENFKLIMVRRFSLGLPRFVVAYLFGGSPGFDRYGWGRGR